MSASVTRSSTPRRRNRRTRRQPGRRRGLQSHFGTERFSLQILQPSAKNYAQTRSVAQSETNIFCDLDTKHFKRRVLLVIPILLVMPK